MWSGGDGIARHAVACAWCTSPSWRCSWRRSAFTACWRSRGGARLRDRRAHGVRRQRRRHHAMVVGRSAMLAAAVWLSAAAVAYAAGRSMQALLAGVDPADTTRIRRSGGLPIHDARRQPAARDARGPCRSADRNASGLARTSFHRSCLQDRSTRSFLRSFRTIVPHDRSARSFRTIVPHDRSGRSFRTIVPHDRSGLLLERPLEPSYGTTVGTTVGTINGATVEPSSHPSRSDRRRVIFTGMNRSVIRLRHHSAASRPPPQ